MRISTSQIYNSGALNIQRNQTALYKLQNQLSTGRRVLTPEDDPVAAAQALIVAQSQAVNGQHLTNQQNATGQLRLVDSQLTSLVNVMQDVREKIVQAGNTATLSNTDRQAIATELESRLGEIVGIANSQNGAGDYLFSGYRGATLPFAINGSDGAYAYSGDDGERLLQVSGSRQMAVSVAGSDVFMNARAGNGSFVTGTGGNVGVSASAGNTGGASATLDTLALNRPQWDAALADPLAGQPVEVRFLSVLGVMNYQISDAVGGLTAAVPYNSGAAIPLITAGGVNFGTQIVVSDGATGPAAGDQFTVQVASNRGSALVDAGSLLDPQKYALAVNNAAAGTPLEIRFAAVGGVMSYGVYDPVGGLTSPLLPFTPGQAIPLVTAGGVDFGSQVVVSGAPASGDTLTVAPSANQSLFQTMQNVIAALRTPIASASFSAAEYSNRLGAQLTSFDQAFANISRVQASVGTRMNEVDSLSSASSDLDIQYQDSLSKLEGLDYVKAISDFTMQQTYLEAAQKSFAKISGLSLFDYL